LSIENITSACTRGEFYEQSPMDTNRSMAWADTWVTVLVGLT